MRIGIHLAGILRKTNDLGQYRAVRGEISKGRQYLLELQKRKLVELLRVLKTNNRYYGPMLEEASEREIEEKPYSVLYALPYLDKQSVREHINDIFTPRLGPSEKRFTGGSTGEPLVYFWDKASIGRTRAYAYYFWVLHGYRFSDSHLVVGGTSLSSRTEKWKAGIYELLIGRRHMKSDFADMKTMARNLRTILSGDYPIVYGYPSVLEQYVDFALNEGMRVIPKMKKIFTTSELLTQEVRKKLELFYDCSVIDMYGANDGGIVSSECEEQSGFHYNVQDCLIEGVQYDSTQETELVVTNLNAFVFPLVRYKVGDIGELSDQACPCGSPLPMIKRLKGRTRDIIRTKKGGMVHGSFFNQIFRKFEKVEKYQIIQNEDRNLQVLVKLSNSAGNESLESLRRAIRDKVLDKELRVTVERVDNFGAETGNKFRNVISNSK